MSIQVIRSGQRGAADHGWLKSKHSFSFADYYNPKAMGFRALRVINEDYIEGGMGFSTHGHRDMEIITYMVSGSLQHKDTLGNTAIIKPGEVQTMTAGTGIRHSEFNASQTEIAHLLQIWILPDREGYKPGYGQKDFSAQYNSNELVLVASADGTAGSIAIHQDAKIFAAKWAEGKKLDLNFDAKRFAWVQMIKGELEVNGEMLKAGDAIALTAEPSICFRSSGPSEFLLFDLQ